MTEQAFKKTLSGYLPQKAVDPVYHLIVKHKIHLLISRERKTKHGDFRPGINGKNHRISVNYNLNPYAFLITFLHETAHQINWIKYGNRVMPHGIEWKNTFTDLLKPFIEDEIFPAEIADACKKEGFEILYSTSADTNLSRVLKKYDKSNGTVLLESLPEKALFMLPNGRKFRKMQKRRKNFLCQSLPENRNYVINPLAEVIPLHNN
jgi:SprT protein